MKGGVIRNNRPLYVYLKEEISMEKVFGATARNDQLIICGTKRAVLIFGYGEENGIGYDYRHTFDHVPTDDEILSVITDQVNTDTGQKILTGFSWNGKKVWLSTENQFNFKTAYDLAVQTGGSSLPVKFKLGEDDTGTSVYHTFCTLEEFTDFYTQAIAFVNKTLVDGWNLKDSINVIKFNRQQQ